MNPRIFISL